jgi:SAM-dependent methyltransferase
MRLIEHVHAGMVYERRTRVLAAMLARLVPADGRVLDVGCGDGLIARQVQDIRPDVSILGVDVLIRPATFIAVTQFDGERLPFADDTFDAVMFVDVLHHADDPAALLGEAVRVSRRSILLKDHRRNGILAASRLRFMDRVGNARHGVALPGNYWSEQEWRRSFSNLGLAVTSWTRDVPLYPMWASWLFGGKLHFVARVEKGPRRV